MKTKLHSGLLVALPMLWAASVEAKTTESPAPNFGVAEKMSFEIEDAAVLWHASGWWAQNAKEGEVNYGVWMRTDAEAAEGSYSAVCKVAQGEAGQAAIETQTIVGEGNNTVQLEEGKKYQLKLKIYIDGTQNAGLNTLQIAFAEILTPEQKEEGLKGNWIDNRFNSLGDLEKDKWVSVSANFTAGSSNVYKMTVKPFEPNCSEQGLLFYVDEFQLMELTETANLGFGDEDMMDFEIADQSIHGGADGWWANPNDGDSFNRTEDKAYSGSASMKAEIPQGRKVTANTLLETDNNDGENAARITEPGDYVLRRYVWLDEDCNKSLTDIFTFLTTGGAWITANVKTADLKKGEWVQLDNNVNFPTAGTGKMIVKLNENAAAEDDVKFYLDAFQLLPAEQSSGIGSASEVKVSVFAQGETIIVNFAPLGETVEVYNLSGVQIANRKVTGASTSFDVADGIYIVKVGNDVLKVVK